MLNNFLYLGSTNVFGLHYNIMFVWWVISCTPPINLHRERIIKIWWTRSNMALQGPPAKQEARLSQLVGGFTVLSLSKCLYLREIGCGLKFQATSKPHHALRPREELKRRPGSQGPILDGCLLPSFATRDAGMHFLWQPAMVKSWVIFRSKRHGHHGHPDF